MGDLVVAAFTSGWMPFHVAGFGFELESLFLSKLSLLGIHPSLAGSAAIRVLAVVVVVRCKGLCFAIAIVLVLMFEQVCDSLAPTTALFFS